MNEVIGQQVPEWLPERFFEGIREELESGNECVVGWIITKPSMIATINYIRNKGYKCEWIEEKGDQFLIKIMPQSTNNKEQP